MTKSTITREQLQEMLEWCEVFRRHPRLDDIAEAIRTALAAMDSEPVAYADPRAFENFESGSARREWMWKNPGEDLVPLYSHAQPAPVVPEEWTIADAVKFCKETGRQDAGTAMDAWNACRAAMLQELQKSAGVEATCRCNENVQAVEVQSLTSINPAPDLVSLQKKAESIIGNYPGIPDDSEHCPCCGKKLRRACSVEGCGGKHVAHGLCQKHYDMKRWEDPEQVERFREAGRRYRGKKKSTEATPQEPKP
ncbi:hypothetical protein ACJ8BJ_00460 [Klebsiella pneumoniae]